MASGGGGGGGGGDGRSFWCHVCEIEVTPVEGVEDDVLCPQCHGGFVEEIEIPPPPPPHAGGAAPRPVIITGGGGVGLGGEEIMSHILESVNAAILGQDLGGGAGPGGAAGPLNPMMVLQSYLQNMLGAAAPRGGNIQIIFDNSGGGGGGGLRMPGAVGDYYLGGGIEQLIQQLMENDPNRYGTPPAAKTAVEDMPTIKITQSHLNSDEAQCAVCKDKFEEGVEARQMPCKHIYHPDCILPWLEMHSTCPVCRYEMPTEDSSQNPQNPSNAASSASSDSNPSGAAGGGGRRFRFQFPLPFHAAAQTPQQGGSSSEQGGAGRNNPGASNNNNNNNEGDNSSEARQEDLD